MPATPVALSAATRAAFESLCEFIAARRRPGHVLVIGINGAQGSGKTTLAGHCVIGLARRGVQAAAVSLDDFYLDRAERAALARRIHPLLATRGVPGTHDVALGMRTLDALRVPGMQRIVTLPHFDKLRDQRSDPANWSACRGPVEVVLFEGWCVGTPPQNADALHAPVNGLESEDDPDGRWRRYVNERLATDYARWFAALDVLVFLQAPDLDCIRRWRARQEAEAAAVAGDASLAMAPRALERFILHFERLTRHAASVLPETADVVFELDARHAVQAVHYRGVA